MLLDLQKSFQGILNRCEHVKSIYVDTENMIRAALQKFENVLFFMCVL